MKGTGRESMQVKGLLFEMGEMRQAVRKSVRFCFVFLHRYVEKQNSCYEPLALVGGVIWL